MSLTQELMDQVVAKVNGQPVTRAQLNAAFEKVKPAGHWKNPIDATVALTDDEIAMVSEAVCFFCGCLPEFEKVANVTSHGKTTGQAKYRVTAIGYFMAIGA